MKLKNIIICLFLAFSFLSCDENGKLDLDKIKNLSETENATGLKEALKVGTKNATQILGKEDGYLKDQAVKILLPEEAQTTFKAIKTIQDAASNPLVQGALSIFDIDLSVDFENTLTTAFNRAAEDAAPKAVDVFVNTISNITINDATNILFSSNNEAATDYLYKNTHIQLQDVFSPIISKSLETVKVAGYTSLDAWDLYATQNNNLAKVIHSTEGQLALTAAKLVLSEEQISIINSVQEVNTNIGNYVVGKALDGIFLKVGIEEMKIRTDVNARTNKILQDVFGQLDSK